MGSKDVNAGSQWRILICLVVSCIIILLNVLPSWIGYTTSNFIPNVVTALDETSGVYLIKNDGDEQQQETAMVDVRKRIQKQLGAREEDLSNTKPPLFSLNPAKWNMSAMIVAMEGVSMFAMSQIQGIAATKTEDIELAITTIPGLRYARTYLCITYRHFSPCCRSKRIR